LSLFTSLSYLIGQDTVSPGSLGHSLPALLVGAALELDDLHVGVGLVAVPGDRGVGGVVLHNLELVLKVTDGQVLSISV